MLKSTVLLSLPPRPPFNTSTPAVMWEYGHRRLVWPRTDCDRRRRDGVKGTGGQGSQSLRMMSSVRFVERSPFFQNKSWIKFHIQSDHMTRTLISDSKNSYIYLHVHYFNFNKFWESAPVNVQQWNGWPSGFHNWAPCTSMMLRMLVAQKQISK